MASGCSGFAGGNRWRLNWTAQEVGLGCREERRSARVMDPNP
jgi:hypothetical protein